MKDWRRALADATARVLHGPRALTFIREGGRLVLQPAPSGRRLGFRANLPWWLRPRPKPLTLILLDELQRVGRKSGIAPWPLEDRMRALQEHSAFLGVDVAHASAATGPWQWMPSRAEKTLGATRYQSDGHRVTDSVPVLQRMVEAWALQGRPPSPHAREFGPVGSDEYYTAQLSTDYERLVGLLDTAVWRQAVDNRRWLAQDATDGYDAETWWCIWRGVLALRWALNQRRGAPAGYLPSREVALRDPGRVSTS